jgi:hypothetical protein
MNKMPVLHTMENVDCKNCNDSRQKAIKRGGPPYWNQK